MFTMFDASDSSFFFGSEHLLNILCACQTFHGKAYDLVSVASDDSRRTYARMILCSDVKKIRKALSVFFLGGRRIMRCPRLCYLS